MTEGRISPLFTWRSALASESGPADYALSVTRAGEETESIVKGATQRHVGLTLSLHMNERGGSCYPGVPKLSSETGLGERSVQRSLIALNETGWLMVERGKSPHGTNLFTATVPPSWTSDEGGVPGTPGVPETVGGVPGTPKDVTKGANVSPTERLRLEHEQIAAAWSEHAPPLIAHRDSYMAAAATRTATKAALKVYEVGDVVSAIAAYATVLGSDAYRWSYQWPLREFLKRGLDRFVPEANPLERERVRSARDARSLEHIADI